MIMRQIMIFVVFFLLGASLPHIITSIAKGEETKPVDKQGLVCVSNENLDQIMTEKGYDVILTMKNSDGVVETLWTAGQSISITAAVPGQDKSCLLAMMKDVTFNPKVIEEVWETYKKQTKQKDI